MALSILLILIIFSVNSLAFASKDNQSSKNESSKEIQKDIKNKRVEGKAEIANEHSGESSENSASEEVKHESAWRIQGWQSIFAALAILYYFLISIKLLPKIASKEVTDKE